MLAVEALGVDPVQVPHTAREIRIWSLHDPMKMVAHLAIGVDAPAKALGGLRQDMQPFGTTGIFKKDLFAPISPRSNVVEPTREFDP
jgi:hypothetical protein